MNGCQRRMAFPACHIIIKSDYLDILWDLYVFPLQKSHKFQRIVVGHRKYRRDFFKKGGEGSHCKTPFSPLPQQGPARIKFLSAQRRCGNRLSAPCSLYRFYQYILPLYAVTWVAFSFTELIVSISSLPVLPSNRRVNRMGWSKGGFISTALLST